MKKALMFLSQGFEDLEAVTIIDVLGWTHVRDHLTPIALQTCTFHDEVVGKFGIKIKVNYNIRKQAVPLEKFDAFVLPGGFHSDGFDEAYSEEIHDLARAIHRKGGFIATMCVGVLRITDAGLLAGKKATTYNLSRFHDNVGRLQQGKAVYTGEKIEMDARIISCAGPASSLQVAYHLVEALSGAENLAEVQKFMMA